MTDPSASRRARGRPPRLSRAKIVEAVAATLLADPTAPLTIARAAEAVGAAPMSLYRHFADRDDLVAAVARHVLADARPLVDSRAPWQEVVRAWMTAVYERARRVPQLMHLMASGESAEWLADSAYLAAAFERAGIEGDRRIAQAVYWVSTTTLGHAMIAAARSNDVPAGSFQAGVGRLRPGDAEWAARLLPHFDDMRDREFGLVVAWTIDGVERLLGRAEPATRPRGAPGGA